MTRSCRWRVSASGQPNQVLCFAAAARLAEISLRGNYANEQADFGNDIARQAYGENKYARLAELKARFDPDNLFRLNQNIEPKRS